MNERILRQHANLLKKAEPVRQELRPYDLSTGEFIQSPALIRESFASGGNVLKVVSTPYSLDRFFVLVV
jgi:hypothetical protein